MNWFAKLISFNNIYNTFIRLVWHKATSKQHTMKLEPTIRANLSAIRMLTISLMIGTKILSKHSLDWRKATRVGHPRRTEFTAPAIYYLRHACSLTLYSRHPASTSYQTINRFTNSCILISLSINPNDQKLKFYVRVNPSLAYGYWIFF